MRKSLASLALALVFLPGCSDDDHHVPVAEDLALEFDEDNYIERAFPVSDAKGHPLLIQILEPPRHGVLSVSGNDFVYSPAGNYNGTDSFRYRARAWLARSEPATVSLTIRPVNDRPDASSVALQTAEDQAVTFTVPMTDIDGDELTLGGGGSPFGLIEILDAAAGLARFTPNANFNGAASLLFSVSDGSSQNDGTAQIAVTPVNDAPVAVNDLFQTTHGSAQSLNLLVNDSDVDGDILTIRSMGSTTGGQLTVAGNVVTFTPNGDFLGRATASYEIVDPAGATATAQISMEVTLGQALLFVADRDTPGSLELFRYDGLGVEKLNLPFNANERLVDFSSSRNTVLYRTRENFTNHLYLRETRPFAPPATRISAHSVGEYYRVGLGVYYLSDNTLYDAATDRAPRPVYTPALPGEFISGVIAEREVSDYLFLTTVQFNPGLGASSLRRITPFQAGDLPLATLSAPNSVQQPLLTLPVGRPAQTVLYSAEIALARAVYSVGAQGGLPTRLSPQFGLNESFSAVQPRPNSTQLVYRGNIGSNVSNLFITSAAQDGTHAQVNPRTSANQEFGPFAVNSFGTHAVYALSDAARNDRRVYVTPLDSPGFGTPVSPSEPGIFGVYDLNVNPQNTRVLYLTATTAAGPSRLLMLNQPLSLPAPVPLHDAGTTLDQLRVSLNGLAATVQERRTGNAVLLVTLLSPTSVRTIHAPAGGDIGVTEAVFEQP